MIIAYADALVQDGDSRQWGTVCSSWLRTEMMGVDMFFPALMISFILGTPRVTFILATPAKWKVFRVIWVPGSPILCAPNAPTVDPAYGIPMKDSVYGHRPDTEKKHCLCAARASGLPETDLSHMSFAAKQESHTRKQCQAM